MSAAAPEVAPLFCIREGRKSDHAFVYSSWLGSDRFSRHGQSYARVYAAEQQRTIADILARSGVSLRTACALDDDDAIVGWSVTQDAGPLACVHYCYVKKGLRRMGVATALLATLLGKRCEFSHQPVIHNKDLRPPAGWTYNPTRAYR